MTAITNANASSTAPTNPATAVRSSGPGRAQAWGTVLTLGFGASTAMWAVGYFTWVLAGLGASAAMVPAFLLLLLLFTFLAGRWGGRWWLGAAVGGTSALANLMVLGGVVAGVGWPASTMAISLLGYVLFCTAVGAGMGALGGRRSTPLSAAAWTTRLAMVAVGATLVLLTSGGLVTSKKAGLAVPDWPGTFAHNMFLYPFSQMHGGVFYEHSHRLKGALVGLVTLAMAAFIIPVDRRWWVRAMCALAVVLVITQGVMGGLRVTKASPDESSLAAGVERSTLEHETTASLHLAVTHGVVGQLFFMLLVSLVVVTGRHWSAMPSVQDGRARALGGLSVGLVVMLVVQLALGAWQRHHGAKGHVFDEVLIFHLMMGTAVVMVGMIVGLLATVFREQSAALSRHGWILLGVLLFQFALGIVTAAVKYTFYDDGSFSTVSIIASSLHQTTGALLLAVSAMVMLWSLRLSHPPSGAGRQMSDGPVISGHPMLSNPASQAG